MNHDDCEISFKTVVNFSIRPTKRDKTRRLQTAEEANSNGNECSSEARVKETT